MRKRTKTTPNTSDPGLEIGQTPVGQRRRRVPAPWDANIGEVLISERQIRQRVRSLAEAITNDYAGKELSVVALLTGTVVFLADLLRDLPLPLRLDFMGVSSYGSETVSKSMTLTKELRMDIRGREVLLVDDILDTGRTLHLVQKKLRGLRPKSLRTCVLLDKPSRRAQPIQADYVGFIIPDLFVVGYGLDYAEKYRNLPFIGVLKEESTRGPSHGPAS